MQVCVVDLHYPGCPTTVGNHHVATVPGRSPDRERRLCPVVVDQQNPPVAAGHHRIQDQLQIVQDVCLAIRTARRRGHGQPRCPRRDGFLQLLQNTLAAAFHPKHQLQRRRVACPVGAAGDHSVGRPPFSGGGMALPQDNSSDTSDAQAAGGLRPHLVHVEGALVEVLDDRFVA